ncbi:cellulase family glycosylhydrolase [Natrarchaeobius sp. A-rgal3]|uniref:cellulase family glycosylhydrolase n=1 Tax=Natrarchaeobius versutus TaxID=1679078 RepID=UPI00350ED219
MRPHTTPTDDQTDPAQPQSQAQPRASRRGVMKAIGAGTVAATLGIAGVSPAAATLDHGLPTDEFVETDGTEFVIDGEPVYFNGANNFWITDDDANEATEERVDAVFDLFDELGINLVRIWAHGEAKEGELVLQPEPGVYNEDALEHHDYVIEAARERGMKLIVALVDNWDHEGGMLQYAEWAGAESRYEFYTMDETREMYRNHVETILTRENSYSGLEWREDPTIAMWELANEPRLEQDDVPADMDTLEPPEHQEILGEWIQDMSAYIKDLDDNHLVSTGSEGHYYGHWEDDYPDDDWDGQDYLEHHSYDTIDAASFHLYPDHWGDDPADPDDRLSLHDGADYITERVEDAHTELGIPAYLGEFNVNLYDHDLETRHEFLEEWYDAADAADCNAVVPWQVVLEDTPDHDGFQLYASDSGYIIEEYADVVAEKSGDWNGDDGDETISVGEYETTDTTSDGLYNDFTGSGDTTHDDVTAFFENLDGDAVQENTGAFDFAENDGVGFADVIDLLRRV